MCQFESKLKKKKILIIVAAILILVLIIFIMKRNYYFDPSAFEYESEWFEGMKKYTR